MDAFQIKYNLRVEIPWLIWWMLTYFTFYLHIVKMLCNVCMSKYRWHGEILGGVCLGVTNTVSLTQKHWLSDKISDDFVNFSLAVS